MFVSLAPAATGTLCPPLLIMMENFRFEVPRQLTVDGK